MFGRLKSNKGFTAVETVISISIFALTGLVLLALLNRSVGCWSDGYGEAFAESGATVAVQKISKDIRDGYLASWTASTLTVRIPIKTTDSEKLYVPGALGQTRTYYLQKATGEATGNLIRSVGENRTILASRVKTLDFRDMKGATSGTGGRILVTVTSLEDMNGKPVERKSSAVVVLRNYH